jgi:hypothetical protein
MVVGVACRIAVGNAEHDPVARYAAARAAGDFEIAAVIAGEAMDLITDIAPAADIIEQHVVTEAAGLFSGASNGATLLYGGFFGTGWSVESLVTRRHRQVVACDPRSSSAILEIPLK